MANLTQAQIESIMEEVVDIRYSDPEQEKALCLKLLQWETLHKNSYVSAFAHTYLGDYYITMLNNEQCSYHLIKARDISLECEYNDLLVRIYSLLGFYYNSISDDQSALEYYIEGLTVCREVHDEFNEAMILNNIGYNLQRSHGYLQALKYYEKAEKLLQGFAESSPLLGILLNNYATVLTLLNRLDEAKAYILSCEQACYGTDQYDIFRSQNWCQYYVAKKDFKTAIQWADKIIADEASNPGNKHYEFDIYLVLFDSILQLHNAEYASKFLDLMEKYSNHTSFLQRQELEIRRVKYAITFDRDETKQNNAYKHYAEQILKLDDIRNTTITNGLNDAVRYLHVNKQKKQLHHEKNALDNQINIDELTKVYTRHYLDELIDRFEQQTYETIGFIMIDVDCLKEYNDTYGHINGDKALRYVGSLLNLHKQENMYPCRFGGDEFVCMCINCTDEQMETYIKHIRNDLYDKHIPHRSSHCSKQITLSIGYVNTQDVHHLKNIFELADKALYRAKQNGRNNYCKMNA